MGLIVKKFGGTSVGSIDRIRNVARRVAKWKAAATTCVVVPSAMAGETNRLIALAKELQPTPDPRELDVVATTGEQVTIGPVAALMQLGQGEELHRLAGEGAHRFGLTKARIVSIDDPIRKDSLGRGRRGGRLPGRRREGQHHRPWAAAARTPRRSRSPRRLADESQIYTDVDGVYTSDPRLVPAARRSQSHLEEMLEMAGAGSKVLQIRSVEFAGKYKVPTRVLSSLTDLALPLAEEARSGTLITFEEDPHMAMEKAVISGVAFNRDEAKITVHDARPLRRGLRHPRADRRRQHRRRRHRAERRPRRHDRHDLHRAPQRLFEGKVKILQDQVKPHIKCRAVSGDERIAKVSIVGMGMRSHAGHRCAHVPHARRGGHQHPDDLDLRDQDHRGDRGEIHRARRPRPAQGV